MNSILFVVFFYELKLIGDAADADVPPIRSVTLATCIQVIILIWRGLKP